MTTWPTTEPRRVHRGDRRTDRDGRRRPSEQTKVVIATDGSAASIRAAEAVAAIYGDADVVVVTVIDGRQVPDRSRAVEVLEHTDAVISGAARLVVRVGSPLAEIMRVVDDTRADVVALGAPTSRLVGRAPVGEQLLRRLDCDVLVVAGDDDRAEPSTDPQPSGGRAARPPRTSRYTSM